MRVLVVEDHQELAEAVAAGLRREGMAVDVSFDGDSALDRASWTDYDVIVLDRDLPGTHGDQVCTALTAAGKTTRILMLTASATIADRVDGLTLGADDYLPKPFAFAELIARIRALGRRAQPAARVRGSAAGPGPAGRGARRPSAAADRQGDGRPRAADGRPGRGGVGRADARTSLGRARRPVHRYREGHHQPAPGEAR